MNVHFAKRHLGWTVNEPPYPSASTIPAEFGNCVRRTPNAVALAIGRPDGPPTDKLTYAELDVRAQALARTLVAGGVKPGDRVGVATQRDFDVAIALLGVLMAGGVYVPLDLSYPRQRLVFMQKDSGIGAVVLSSGLDPAFAIDGVRIVEIGASPAPAADGVELRAFDAADAAYVIYSSGSTGEP